MKTLISCGDRTCKHNDDGYCKKAFLNMAVDFDIHSNAVVICQDYTKGAQSSDGTD